MLEEMDRVAISVMIRKAADRNGLWAVSSQRNRKDHSERVWWFRRPSEKQITKSGLTDKAAIVWLQHEDLESMRNLRLHD